MNSLSYFGDKIDSSDKYYKTDHSFDLISEIIA